MQPTTTLSLQQIHFLNHFIANKPPSFRNPHTLYNNILHTHSFKSLSLDFTLIKQYTHLLYKQQLSKYISKLKNNGKSSVPSSPSLPPPPRRQAYILPKKEGRLKKFTNFLKKNI